MGMKIPGVMTPGIPPEHPLLKPGQASRPRFPESESHLGRMASATSAQSAREAQGAQEARTRQDLQRSLAVLEETFRLFNRRLKFSVNEEIDRVVVKVVDGSTDKVIKEIPPEEIQRLIVRIKETIGLLFDEQI
jgi:flagellar protein FlaG